MARKAFHNKAKPDSERRERQATRIAAMVKVHRLTGGCTNVDYPTLAKQLALSERTIRRHVDTLQVVYLALGSNSLDN